MPLSQLFLGLFNRCTYRASHRVPVSERDWIRISGDYFTYTPFWSAQGATIYFYARQDTFDCLYARRLDAVSKHPKSEAYAVHHFHGDLRPPRGYESIVGYGLAGNRLYVPLSNEKGNVWLAEQEPPK